MLTVYQDQPLRVVCNSAVDVVGASRLYITASDGVAFNQTYDAQIYNGDPRKVYCDIPGGVLPACDQIVFRCMIHFADLVNPYPGELKYIAIESLDPPLGIGNTNPGLSLRAYRYALRMFLRDFDEMNRLLNFKAENEIEFLDLYIYMSMGFFNAMPPPVGIETLATFPIPNLIIHHAAIESLTSCGIGYSRNDLTYNNGGVTVKVSDGARYMGALQTLYRINDMEMAMYKQIKIGKNIMGGFGGGVSSPYAFLHGRYATLQPNSLFSGR